MQMQLQAIPTAGSVFDGWSDGNTANPRLIDINGNMNISAKFK
jgi:hypothetical protein